MKNFPFIILLLAAVTAIGATTVNSTKTNNSNFKSGQVMVAGSTLTTPLVLKGVASQSANLFSIKNSTNTVLNGFDSAGALISGGGASILDCSILLNTPSGYGSSGTKIVKFTNSVGTCSSLTYNASATNGDNITIVDTGLYSLELCLGSNGGGTLNMAISKNSNQLSTSSYSITAAHRLMQGGAPSNMLNCLAIVRKLTAGDILRAHTGAEFGSFGVAYETFEVIRIL